MIPRSAFSGQAGRSWRCTCVQLARPACHLILKCVEAVRRPSAIGLDKLTASVVWVGSTHQRVLEAQCLRVQQVLYR